MGITVRRFTGINKVVWLLAVIVPLLGSIAYFIIGRKQRIQKGDAYAAQNSPEDGSPVQPDIDIDSAPHMRYTNSNFSMRIRRAHICIRRSIPLDSSRILKDKVVLVVDDEPDVLDTIADVLAGCLVTKARDFDTGRQYLMGFTYDIVILDIMGVDGFELLKIAVKRGFPAVMLTAYALTPEALEKSMRLGAVSFLPKEKMSDLDEYLADVVLGGSKPVWDKLFDKLGHLFNKRFGPDWKERNKFFKDFQSVLSGGGDKESQ